MTVSELIELLQQMDPDDEILAGPNTNDKGPMMPVEGVNRNYAWILTA